MRQLIPGTTQTTHSGDIIYIIIIIFHQEYFPF